MGEDGRGSASPLKATRALRGGFFLAGCGLAAALFSSSLATAKSDYTSPYGYDKTWNSALRLVRVDLGFKVLERDEKTGYLMFEYRSPESGPKAVSASLEVVRGGGAEVKVVAQISQMPRYHEQVILDDLAKKLHDDYGDPPAAPPKEEPSRPRAAPQVDAGADASDDDYDRDPSAPDPAP